MKNNPFFIWWFENFFIAFDIYYKKYTDMAISEKELKKIVNESVRKVINERNYRKRTENVLGFLISKEMFDEIKMGKEPEVVLINHLYEELAHNPKCAHFVAKMIIKKVRGEM